MDVTKCDTPFDIEKNNAQQTLAVVLYCLVTISRGHSQSHGQRWLASSRSSLSGVCKEILSQIAADLAMDSLCRLFEKFL